MATTTLVYMLAAAAVLFAFSVYRILTGRQGVALAFLCVLAVYSGSAVATIAFELSVRHFGITFGA